MKIKAPLIIIVFVFAFLLLGCGPSQVELNATSTQIAENDSATQTAQAPTATPTHTLTPTATSTPTYTPTPTSTDTPTPTITPTPGLSSLALTLEDMPAGFDELPNSMLQPMEQVYPGGSDVFGYADFSKGQYFIGIIVPFKSIIAQDAFDNNLEMAVESMAESVSENPKLQDLTGIDDIGDSRKGSTFTGSIGSLTMNWNIIGFRRGPVGVIMMLYYFAEREPAVTVADLARQLDTRIQGYITGGY